MKSIINFISTKGASLFRNLIPVPMENSEIKMREIAPLFYLYQLYKYLIFYPSLAMATIFFTVLSLMLLAFRSERLFQVGGILWARYNSLMTPMFVKVHGKDNIDKNQSYVVVANHLSMYDIFVVYGWLPVDFRWIMKMELRKVPVLGYFCFKAGHVFINRSNSDAARSSINEAKKRIVGGTSIFFFPEGTRSSNDKMLPFKKGAFKFAIDMGLPVLPVTIINTEQVLPNNTTALFPGWAKLIINGPIKIEDYNNDNIEDLIGKAKSVIEKGYNDHKDS